jgi:hypothetical protein
MAEKAVLTIVQDFCKRVGLPVPAVAAGSTDDTTVQVVGLLNEGIQDIIDRYALQQLTTYKSFQHANGPNYLALDLTKDVPDWKYTEQLTLWDEGTRLTLWGPATTQQWAQMMTMKIAPAPYVYILIGNAIRIYPVPDIPASVTFSFYYQSRCGVTDGTNVYETYDKDTYSPRIPTYLVEADLKWRWKKEKGLPYAEDQRIAESMLVNLVGRSPQPILNLDAGERSYAPGIFVSPGSWNV